MLVSVSISLWTNVVHNTDRTMQFWFFENYKATTTETTPIQLMPLLTDTTATWRILWRAELWSRRLLRPAHINALRYMYRWKTACHDVDMTSVCVRIFCLPRTNARQTFAFAPPRDSRPEHTASHLGQTVHCADTDKFISKETRNKYNNFKMTAIVLYCTILVIL